MSCQSAPVLGHQLVRLSWLANQWLGTVKRRANRVFFFNLKVHYFIIGFFEFGQGHRGPMIPYCPGAP
ncbi:unnamed protein product, partial [Staurois parvus]